MPDDIIQKSGRSSKSTFYFHHAGLSHTGMLREHNEDNFTLPAQFEMSMLDSKGYLYVLADGMGGHQKGEIAAAVTVEAVPSIYYSTIHSLDDAPLDDYNSEDIIINALAEAIAEANAQVMVATEGGGTTIVSAVLYTDLLVMMNVGDSRAYLLRDNKLKLISRDHSLVARLVEMGKITPEEALTHPRRNVLYQALGQGSDLEIHVVTEKLHKDDVVILCSDGLWGEIDEADLKQVLTSVGSPQTAAKQLVDLANAAGGPDNITVIVVKVSDQEPPASQFLYQPQPRAAADDETQPSPFVQSQR